jgi:hypothetical protein
MNRYTLVVLAILVTLSGCATTDPQTGAPTALGDVLLGFGALAGGMARATPATPPPTLQMTCNPQGVGSAARYPPSYSCYSQ